MISNYRMLVGPRGRPVCLSCDYPDVDGPLLTVALSSKWYGLCLLRTWREGVVHRIAVEELDFGVLEEIRQAPFGPSLCDHVPNPAFVERLAQEKGWEIDDLGWELIVGRWHAEIVGLRGAAGRSQVTGHRLQPGEEQTARRDPDPDPSREPSAVSRQPSTSGSPP